MEHVLEYKHLILADNQFLNFMSIDERIRTAGQLIMEGEISTFEELFKYVPKTALAVALFGSTSKWYETKFKDPYFFRVGELLQLAELMNIEAHHLLEIMKPSIKAITNRKFSEKPKPLDEDVEKLRKKAKELKDQGLKNKEIYEMMGISRQTLYRYLNDTD
ncbi:putative XRE-type DNA-binding protein [Pedobacter sp. CG_S7]|uniref:helix-turn-helix domain-containing protein n=1 Tax=Pedobacter sp. CG_S7 TaxID=3143930 RepID=UPI00339367F8